MPFAPAPLPRCGSNTGPPPARDGAAHRIEVATSSDGMCSVTSSRNGSARPAPRRRDADALATI